MPSELDLDDFGEDVSEEEKIQAWTKWKEEKRQVTGWRGVLNSLSYNIILYFRSYISLKTSEKINRKQYKAGLYTDEEFERIKNDPEAFHQATLEKTLEVLNVTGRYYLDTISTYFQIPVESIPFEGFLFDTEPNFTRTQYDFEGSISIGKENATIKLTPGVTVFLENLSDLFGVVAYKVPPLNELVAFYTEMLRVFYVNTRPPSERDILSRTHNPNDAEVISPEFNIWKANLVKHQFKLSQDLRDAMLRFIIAHELSHLLIRKVVGWNHPIVKHTRARAVEYCQQHDVPLNENWIEEFVCDSIGVQLAIRYLHERDQKDFERCIDEHDNGLALPFSCRSSRGKNFDKVIEMQDAMFKNGSEKAYNLDVYVSTFSAFKILLTAFSDYEEYVAYIEDKEQKGSYTHPPSQHRLAFILWDANQLAEGTSWLYELGNGFDILRRCMYYQEEDPQLHHPIYRSRQSHKKQQSM